MPIVPVPKFKNPFKSKNKSPPSRSNSTITSPSTLSPSVTFPPTPPTSTTSSSTLSSPPATPLPSKSSQAPVLPMPMAAISSPVPAAPASESPKVYNVLVLGETQSGKSTLVEFMKKYADPSVAINTKLIGTGFLSHTEKPSTYKIHTNLPEYHVADSTPKAKEPRVNYGEFLSLEDPYDFEDELNRRRNLTLVKGESSYPEMTFNIIDTPGLNATEGDDEQHVQKIFNALIDAKTIHLLIITISSGPFTQGLQDAIKCYVDMFPDFNGIIAFVHTHFNYNNLHPVRAQGSQAIEIRMDSLHKIMGRNTFAHFKIDCDVYNKKPIRDCITQNTLQRILELATFNRPVDMKHTVVNKTRKMRDIDNLLRDKFEATSRTIEQTLRFKDKEEGDLLSEIFMLETTIHKQDARIDVLKEYLIRHDVTRHEILFEQRRDLDYEAEGKGQKLLISFPPNGEGQPHIIEDKKMIRHGVNITEESGGRGSTFWWAEFERISPQNCVLHVKLYTAKRNKHLEEIAARKAELANLEEKRRISQVRRDEHAIQHRDKKEQIRDIVDNHADGIQILKYVTNEVISPDVFAALMNAKAYMGNTALCARQVQAVYTELARMELLPRSSSMGSRQSTSGSERQNSFATLR
ncbi:hypothetical protein BGZ94_000330 [Podila epigama]|nr:hypothetical protein BGZ94_000330 [Podila epigama]